MQRKTRGGVVLARGTNVEPGEAAKAIAIGCGGSKLDLGSLIECPCEVGNEIVFRFGVGCDAARMLRFENGHGSLADDEFVILIRFEDILGVIVELEAE